ncbi:MAG: DUF4271 domain-containing protein [Flavobacteriales bacterium]|nr:DUF4271 domain-containing protein [Flavobacteriales bacterium]
MEGMPRALDPLAADWLTGVLLSCCLVLATINLGSPKKWRVLRQAAFRLRLGRQILREEVESSGRNLLGLQAVAGVCIALLLWQSALYFGLAEPGPFMNVALGVGLVLIIQALLLRTIALLARSGDALREYQYSGTLLHAAAGVALLPLVSLAAYQPAWRFGLLAAGLLILAIALCYRWLRALVISWGEGIPARYVFLYICAAEIMPLALALSALRQEAPSLEPH